MMSIALMDGEEWKAGVAYARGQFVDPGQAVIPVEDRAHQFGDGIYEVIRVLYGKPLLLNYHLERFETSAKAVRIPLERPIEALRDLIFEAIGRAGLPDAQVYFQLSRGIARRDHAFPHVNSHLSLTVRPLVDTDYHQVRSQGLKVMWADDVRWKYCYIKSLNLLPNVMAKQAAHDAGYQDAIFVRDGFVTEGSSSNIAIAKNRVLYTHPANESVLHGVTRRFALEYLKKIGVETREQAFTTEDLLQADEVIMMNTVAEFVPIVEVEGQQVGRSAKEQGSILNLLQTGYSTEVRGD